jgi:nitrate reductase cytochrome c-type subunit
MLTAMAIREDDMTDDRVCVDCHAHAPATNTGYTLISAKHGWRLSRSTANGKIAMEWHCPSCWEKYKKKNPNG